jgi:hypothetical protein
MLGCCHDFTIMVCENAKHATCLFDYSLAFFHKAGKGTQGEVPPSSRFATGFKAGIWRAGFVPKKSGLMILACGQDLELSVRSFSKRISLLAGIPKTWRLCLMDPS